MATPGALSGLRVVEYAQLAAAPYGARLLADLGADVIKVEPPGGDAARGRGPFAGGTPHPERSGLFQYANAGKRGVVLDLADPLGRARFYRLLRGADVLIHDQAPAAALAAGLSLEALTAVSPRLVVVSVTPFGHTGPYRNRRAYPVNVYQSSGEGYLTPARCDRSDRPPVHLGRRTPEFIAGVAAAAGALLGVRARDATGTARHVDLSEQEVLMFMNLQDLPRYLTAGAGVGRGQRGYRVAGIHPCQDGHVIFYYHRPTEWAAMVEIIGRPDWAADPVLANRAVAEARWPEVTTALAAGFGPLSKADLLAGALEHGCALAPCRTAAEVVASEHLAARGFFADLDHPKLGRLRLPGGLFHMSATPPAYRRPAPRLDEHQDLWRGPAGAAAIWGRRPKRTVRRRRTRPYPLSGVRVLDFAWGWAGPLVSAALGALGADVVKVESSRRMDFNRQLADPVMGTPDSPNCSLSFNVTNINRRSITIDLQHPRGRALVQELVRAADVLIESFRPGVAARLGLGYEDLRRTRPDIVMLSFSANGQDGPESALPGYGPVFAALGGLSEITGYPDGPPAEVRAPADVLGSYAGLLGVLSALHHRDRTGEGQWIDCAGQEIVAAVVGDVLVDYAWTGTVAGRRGNADDEYAPCNCYPAAGDDVWISIVVGGDAEWRALRQAMGDPAWAADPRYDTAAGRRAHAAELDRGIGSWTAQHPAGELAGRLQRAGVAAVPSYTLADLAADPHLREREAFICLEHAEAGTYRMPGLPWRLPGAPCPAPRPAPLLGEHTDRVLLEWLGRSAAQAAELRRSGALT